MSCRKMGIEILSPDVNEGFSAFSVSNGCIRYGMSAIKGVGTSVIDTVVEEREKHGKYTSMQEFMTRLSSKEVNKHTIENFIKSGAFDGLPGNRKQKMAVYQAMMDTVNREKKDSLAGQMSLFDLGDEELQSANEIAYPDVEEFEKEELLAYEKEMLGIYISGHPLEEYVGLMQKNCTRNSLDFMVEEEGENAGMVQVEDGETVIIGGMITEKTVKTTKTNSLMAFFTVEDLYGTVEIIVFPRDYEKKKELLVQDAKVFVKGRASVEENRNAKIICQDIIPFEEVPCELWLRFADKETYVALEETLYGKMAPYDGRDVVYIYLQQEKQIKCLPKSRSVDARRILSEQVLAEFSGITAAIKERPITS